MRSKLLSIVAGVILGLGLSIWAPPAHAQAGPFSAQIQALLNSSNTWAGTQTFTNATVSGTCTGCGGGSSSNYVLGASPSTSTVGIVYRGTAVAANRFIHDYDPGTPGYNLFVGLGAGNFTMTTSNHELTGIGYQALTAVTTAQNTVGIGSLTLSALTSGSSLVAIGTESMITCTICTTSVAVGFRALNKQLNTIDNVAVGSDALRNFTGGGLTAVGANALTAATDAAESVAIGQNALRSSVHSINNIAIGQDSMVLVNGVAGVGGSPGNTAIGGSTLFDATDPQRGIALGYEAGSPDGAANQRVANDQDFIFIGYQSGKCTTTALAQFVDFIVIGSQARPGNCTTVSHSATLGSLTTTATYLFGPLFQNSLAQVVSVTGDFTTANNTNLQIITGLTWTLPANLALSVPFRCVLFYSQAGAAVSDSFGVQTDTVTPTNFQVGGSMETALGTTAYGDATISNTTATAAVTGTPSATATIFNAYVDGLLENPSNASPTTLSIQVKTSVGTDAITVKRGSFCRAF
jgi:hypothetical protein